MENINKINLPINSNSSVVHSKSRRKKKRRTQASDSEFSLSSSSSSLSEDENEVDQAQVINVELSDVEINCIQEEKSTFFLEQVGNDARKSLSSIQLTNTDLSNRKINGKINKIVLKETADKISAGERNFAIAADSLAEDVNSLKNEYLNMIFDQYGEDINQLRNAPDFTNNSLVMLANVLKDGGDMFNIDTFKTIVENK